MRWPLVVALVAVVAFVASATTVGAERLITGADIKDGSITGRSPTATWLNQVNAQTWIPMAVVASATYTGQTSINLTCGSQFASAGMSSASLVAEQVSLVSSQRS